MWIFVVYQLPYGRCGGVSPSAIAIHFHEGVRVVAGTVERALSAPTRRVPRVLHRVVAGNDCLETGLQVGQPIQLARNG